MPDETKRLLGMAERKAEGGSTMVDVGYVRGPNEIPEEGDAQHPPMTVGDLIAILQKHPKHMRVFVRGYEGGISDPIIADAEPIDLNVNPDSHVYGCHDRRKQGWTDATETVTDLVIDRP